MIQKQRQRKLNNNMKKTNLYFGVFCLICLSITPIIFSNSTLRLFWLYPEKYDIEIIKNITYTTSAIFFPLFFTYKMIIRKKINSILSTILKISLILFIIELICLIIYIYLLSRAIHT